MELYTDKYLLYIDRVSYCNNIFTQREKDFKKLKTQTSSSSNTNTITVRHNQINLLGDIQSSEFQINAL